jgi:hypothetical protein
MRLNAILWSPFTTSRKRLGMLFFIPILIRSAIWQWRIYLSSGSIAMCIRELLPVPTPLGILAIRRECILRADTELTLVHFKIIAASVANLSDTSTLIKYINVIHSHVKSVIAPISYDLRVFLVHGCCHQSRGNKAY